MKHFLGLLLFIGSISISPAAFSQIHPFDIQPADKDVAKLYLAMLDRDIETLLKRLDNESGLLNVTIPDTVTPGMREVRTLSLEERIRLSRDPNYEWSYWQTRSTAELAGALGYAYHMPPSKFYQSGAVLQALRSIFDAFAAAQSPEGEFIFSSIRYNTVRGTYELAWQLEPLMIAFSLVKDRLPAGERKTVEEMLRKGLDFLVKHPDDSVSFRGMVWCGVMALAHQYNNNPQFLEAASQKLERLRTMFKPNGEVVAGSGPDLRESAISIQYLFLYRLMSGHGDLDDILVRSLKWYTRLYTFHAVPLEGMSTQNRITNGSRVAALLGALTYYAEREPSFLQIATRYLEALITFPSGFSAAFGAGHFLRGMIGHRRVSELKPIPYTPYAQLYENEHSLYFLVGKNYQTAVTLRGRLPMKGMQTWSYRGEPPLIAPSKTTTSQVIGFGYNSALMDTNWEPNEVTYRHTVLDGGIDVLTYMQGGLVTAYIFSPDMTVVVFRDLADRTVVDWAMQNQVCAQAIDITPQGIQFGDSRAKLLFPNIQPDMVEASDAMIARMRFTNDFAWYTFAGPDSAAIVQPVIEGMILIQLNEAGERTNLVVNMAKQPYTVPRNFPNTSIPIPLLEPFDATLVEKE